MYVYIYIYIHICMYIYIYIYISLSLYSRRSRTSRSSMGRRAGMLRSDRSPCAPPLPFPVLWKPGISNGEELLGSHLG